MYGRALASVVVESFLGVLAPRPKTDEFKGVSVVVEVVLTSALHQPGLCVFVTTPGNGQPVTHTRESADMGPSFRDPPVGGWVGQR
ncbi:hypothetical protein RRG08_004968 [Elysia crispata]|uniref:Uncharacterized protein n=1 Tax=Elysia crispata TaxID=231223 RepID=A0AAE0ZHW9_9GAST|nr:hypothetical protein RRG08_004968 [Elysia crispata]